MTMLRYLMPAAISPVGEDEVRVVMSTSALARDGHILSPQGCRLDEYRKNPIVLFSHDPMYPIGNANDIAVTPSQISCTIKFAPLGVSAKADEVRGLMKAGVLRCVSVGFDPITMTPLDPSKPRGGQRISVWTLLELSAVAVPADAGALVTARSLREGKTLSGANASALQEAHRLAEQCRSTISDVLTDAGHNADFERRQRQLEVRRLAAGPDVSPAPRPVRKGPTTAAERQREVARLTPSKADQELVARARARDDMHNFLIAANGGPARHERLRAVQQRTPKR